MREKIPEGWKRVRLGDAQKCECPLGHSVLATTTVYLRMSGQEAKEILREKGLI